MASRSAIPPRPQTFHRERTHSPRGRQETRCCQPPPPRHGTAEARHVPAERRAPSRRRGSRLRTPRAGRRGSCRRCRRRRPRPPTPHRKVGSAERCWICLCMCVLFFKRGLGAMGVRFGRWQRCGAGHDWVILYKGYVVDGSCGGSSRQRRRLWFRKLPAGSAQTRLR